MAYGQFKRLKELLKIKRNIFNQYKNNFSNLNVVFNNDNTKLKNGLWATVIIFDKKYNLKVPKLIYFLKNKKIYSKGFF